MTDIYQKITLYILSLFSGSAAEISGMILLIVAGWMVVKRRLFMIALVLVMLSLSVAVGSTMLEYFRGL